MIYQPGRGGVNPALITVPRTHPDGGSWSSRRRCPLPSRPFGARWRAHPRQRLLELEPPVALHHPPALHEPDPLRGYTAAHVRTDLPGAPLDRRNERLLATLGKRDSRVSGSRIAST